MPLRNAFRMHKKAKNPMMKRGTREVTGSYSGISKEPPDCAPLSDQIGEVKLQNQHVYFHSSHYDKTLNSKSLMNKRHADSMHVSFVSSPLSRASSAPHPVTIHSVSDAETCAKSVRKNSSASEGLGRPEVELHGQRLKDLTQLEHYISHLRQTSDDDSLPYMPSRLCCAQVLVTLYLRHEQQYFRQGKSLDLRNASPTRPLFLEEEEEGGAEGNRLILSGTCSDRNGEDDITHLMTHSKETWGNVTVQGEHHDFHRGQKQSTSRHLPPTSRPVFSRKTVGRVPVIGRQHRPRDSSSMTTGSNPTNLACSWRTSAKERAVTQCDFVYDNYRSSMTHKAWNEASPTREKIGSPADNTNFTNLPGTGGTCWHDFSSTSIAKMPTFTDVYEIY